MRPHKQGLDYYPLSVDFFNDDCIRAISSEFGIRAEIVTIKVILAIFKRGYYLNWCKAEKLKLLASLPGISINFLEQTVARLVKWNFFHQEFFESNKILTSSSIQTLYFKHTRRRRHTKTLPFLIIAYNNGVIVDNNSVNVDNNGVSAYNNSVNVDNNGVSAYNNSVYVDNNGVSAYNNSVNVDNNGVSAYNNGVIVDNNSVYVDNNPQNAVKSEKNASVITFNIEDNIINNINSLNYNNIYNNKEIKKNKEKNIIKKEKEENKKASANASGKEEKSCAKKEERWVKYNPPSLDEVQYYCQQKGSNIDPEAFLAHYTAVGWIYGKSKHKVVDWRACIKTWERSNNSNHGTTRTQDRTSYRDPAAEYNFSRSDF